MFDRQAHAQVTTVSIKTGCVTQPWRITMFCHFKHLK